MADKDPDEPGVDLNFLEKITHGSQREVLDAMIEFVAKELSGNRCSKCMNSNMKSSDLASLVLRLQKLIEDRDALPTENDEKTQIEKMQEARNQGAQVTALPGTLGTKKAPRQQGGRTYGFGSR